MKRADPFARRRIACAATRSLAALAPFAALADSVTAKPGLPAGAAAWPIPVYSAHVSVDTSDSPANVLAWYRARLGSRATSTGPARHGLSQYVVAKR